MKRKVLLIGLLILLVGCGVAGIQLTPPQEEAIAKAAGNAFGFVIAEKKPELVPVVQEFCFEFIKAQGLAESQKLFDTALVYLADRYAGDKRFGKMAINTLKIIGFDESQVSAYFDRKIGRINPLTMKMLHNAILVVKGVCEVM